MQKIDLISDGQSLIGATNRFGLAIEVYDDGFGPLWIHRHSIGISGIVRAQTWEDAYSICEDEFFPEASETLAELQNTDAWLDNGLFQESFGFRPNGPNKNDRRKHGIYAKDLNGDRLDRLTPELLNRLEISLQIEAIS